MARIIDAFHQFFDNAGDPLSGGFINFFQSGSATVRKDTFSDVDETASKVNSNPVELDAAGRAPNIFGTGTYNAILTDSNDVQITPRDPVGSFGDLTFGSPWSSQPSYSAENIVLDDGRYWESLTNSNQGNKPSSDSGLNWEILPLKASDQYGQPWATFTTYPINHVVLDGGEYWISVVESNAANNPSSDSGANWLIFKLKSVDQYGATYSATVDYIVGEVRTGSDSSLYISKIANGPASSVVGPVGDLTGTWELYYIDYVDSKREENGFINGQFDEWQRGFASGFFNSSIPTYTADRYFVDGSAIVINPHRVTFALGQTEVPNSPKYHFAITANTTGGASEFANVQQRISRVATFAGEVVTFSFYVKANIDIAVEFVQNFGTGGSPSTEITSISVTSFDVSGTIGEFVKKTVTLTVPSISGKSLGTNDDDYFSTNIWVGAGSDFNARTNSLGGQSGTVNLVNWYIHRGAVALDYPKQSAEKVLSECQPFAELLETDFKMDGLTGSASQVSYGQTFSYMTEKRGAPTLSIVSQSGTDMNISSTTAKGTSSVRIVYGVLNGLVVTARNREALILITAEI
jgi:hypothetical protein